jgi:hypothetical protein
MAKAKAKAKAKKRTAVKRRVKVAAPPVIKIHYRNLHGTTNTPWQNAFRKYGELSLGDTSSGGFPDEMDHLHLGGSCKGAASVRGNPITVDEVKKVQKATGCSISVFFGDAVSGRFRFHHDLLDAGIPKLKIYSASLYGTPMWRPEVTWVAHPTDEDIFRLVKHKKNDKVLFVGSMTPYRKSIITALHSAGIEVDIVSSKYGKDLVEVSKNYSVSIGMFYEESLPRIRYFSVRLPDALAMGLIHIEAGFDLDGYLNKDEVIQWHTVDELVEKIKYYQSHLKEGRDIVTLGRKVVLENWTFNKLAERFVS